MLFESLMFYGYPVGSLLKKLPDFVQLVQQVIMIKHRHRLCRNSDFVNANKRLDYILFKLGKEKPPNDKACSDFIPAQTSNIFKAY